MVTPEEGFCRNDADCSAEQYCYRVSERCVDYTHCSRYNREENQKRSRNPSQCGPCLSGYTAEKLSTGEIAALCRKMNANDSAPEILQPNSYIFCYIAVGFLAAGFVIAALYGLFFRTRLRRRPSRQDDPEQPVELCPVKPSAPPIESNPLMDYREKLQHLPFNNNRNYIDRNTLVCASGFEAPNWIRANPNYENNSDNDTSEMDQLHTGTELPQTSNSNTWTPEQLTPSERIENEMEYEIEEMDNNANAILSNDNNNNNNGGNNNGNGNASSENNSDDTRRPGGALDVLLILMKLKVRNGD